MQELLFEHLQVLVARALSQAPGERGATISECVCKAAEVDATLRKHLAKEEEQLFPLLLARFSHREQAELVVLFVCCIPVLAVRGVLAWLKRACSRAEQTALLQHVAAVTQDAALAALLAAWLRPSETAASAAAPAGALLGGADGGAADGGTGEAAAGEATPAHDPLDHIVSLHSGILLTLEALA